MICILVSDLLVTDYSSVFFDYANLKRPMLFYAYDYEHYRDNLRGFYFDLEKDAPGPFVTNEKEFFKELYAYINEIKSKKYSLKIEEFYNKYCEWEDGEAAVKLARIIQKNSCL